jgi:group I intron endonuclease
MKSGVYKIYFKNDTKNKVYIGISNNLTRRKTDHSNSLLENCHKNKFLQNAYKKYGVENFVFEILQICDVESLVKKEEEYIKKYNSFNNKFGYNLTTGGEHKRLSESTKKKLSIVKSGRKLLEKTKIKLAVHNLLKVRPELKIEVIGNKIFVEGKEYVKSKKGKFKTPADDVKYAEKIKIISKRKSEFAKNLGTNRVKSKEEIEKIRNANTGKKASIETKKKIGSYHIGKEITDEHKKSISKKLGHDITLINTNGSIINFDSKSQCAKFLKCGVGKIDRYYTKNKLIKYYNIKINNYA